MSIPKAIDGAMNLWTSAETALRATNPSITKENLYLSSAEIMNQGLHLKKGETRTVFDDHTYCVRIGPILASIARKDGAQFYVPAGHAWFDRLASVNTTEVAERLYAELVALK